jgi:hypothetical protein
LERKISYLDIISESIAYFTEIPKDYIKLHFERLMNSTNEDTSLLWSMMKVEFPEKEGIILADYLKSLELVNTMQYISNSMKLYKNELYRQASYN